MGGSRGPVNRDGGSVVADEVERDGPDIVGVGLAIHHQGGEGMGASGVGCGPNSCYGDSGKGVGIGPDGVRSTRNIHSGGGVRPAQLRGNLLMDTVYSFIAYTYGHILAFVAGAWIGRPLFAYLSSKIIK